MNNKSTAIGSMTKIESYGADAEYARRILKSGPQLMEAFALVNKSVAARGPLAKAISNGRMNYDQLITAVRATYRATEEGLAGRFASRLNPRPFITLARIVADQAVLPEDAHDAVMLFKFALVHYGKQRFRKDDRLVMLEQLGDAGFRADVRKYSSIFGISQYSAHQLDLLLANTYLPFEAGHNDEAVLSAWLAHTNKMYLADNMEPIDVAPGSGAAMDRITCAATDYVDGGPKVSVIIPTYNSGPRISTAIRSLLAQSWRNLEILIMDDCSPEENNEHLYHWADLDPRIQVIRLPENGGTYKARNIALARYVTGDLVTVHDDDDWSHPRKIQVQVEHLLEDRTRIANVSLLSRTTPNLKFTRINSNPVFLQRNFSSLMFWKDPVVQHLGYWDLVNRSSDAEMHDRISSFFNQPIETAGSSAMSFLRVREDSLTSGEIYKGYIDQRRLWYQRASRAWHAQELSPDGSGSLYISADNSEVRAFKAPAGMVGSKQARSRLQLDIIYATDFRFPGGNSSISGVEIELLLSRGFRVGLMQIDSPVNGSKLPIRQKFFDLALHENCQVISRFDPVDADLLIIRHPSVLQYMDPSPSDVQCRNLVVVVNHAPFGRDGKESIYDMRDVVRNAHSVFGMSPVVAPESGLIRELLRDQTPPSSLSQFDWNGTIATPDREPRIADPLRAPVIGRHARDHAQKWPQDRAVLETVYPVTGEHDIRVLGGADHAVEVLQGQSPAWKIYEFGSVEPSDFLDELDFWVYFHDDNLVESFGMSTAEAITKGLVVILPKYMEETFGRGALYADPHEVWPIINRVWNDQMLYRAQSERALGHSRENFSHNAFFSRIDSFLQEED